MLYASIIIPLAIPKVYTWAIPAHLEKFAQIGVRAEVPFGKNKKYAGIIKFISQEPPKGFQPKFILNILDQEPIVFQTQLAFWEWMSSYYMCTEGEVMYTALPSNFKLSSETTIIRNEATVLLNVELDDEEFLVAEALEMHQELKIHDVQKILQINHVYPVIKRLIEKQVCFIAEELQRKYTPKMETFITLHPNYHQEEKLADLLNHWSRAPKQLELLLGYLHFQKTEGRVIQSALLKKTGASAAQLKALFEKEILVATKTQVDRIEQLPPKITINFELSNTQQAAFNQIQQVFQNKNVCLLHGITGSGKTQIYIQLIKKFIEQNKQVLYLLPEIALTAQIIKRLRAHFGGHIAVYHSKFNANERVEIWNKVKNNQVKVILGARSAVFLPFNQLGLVVIDEEHDPSFKQQEPAPRYHGRDSAIYLAALHNNAKVLLGSATPSIETYYNASNNKYGLVELNERFGAGTLPNIQIIALKGQTSSHKKIPITEPLKAAIAETLNLGKQVILFQNRRGYAPYFICNTCGWIPQCTHCDVTLTYHKIKNKMACHYCGSAYPVVKTCNACGSVNFIRKDFGTEQVEELVQEAFPLAKIARMDYDSIRGKHDHDQLIQLFEAKKIDILIGTQMVVKGLDFENVQLVGILDGDGILSFTDFRVNERGFQLMEQVSGRAGRKDNNGLVMIQIKNPNHPVLQFVQQHNYRHFYAFEIENRRQFFYPPFTRIIQVIFKDKSAEKAAAAAQLFASGLKSNFEKYLNGPTEPIVNKVRNLYLRELFIKLPKQKALLEFCRNALEQQSIILQSHPNFKSVQIIINIDPV